MLTDNCSCDCMLYTPQNNAAIFSSVEPTYNIDISELLLLKYAVKLSQLSYSRLYNTRTLKYTRT